MPDENRIVMLVESLVAVLKVAVYACGCGVEICVRY